MSGTRFQARFYDDLCDLSSTGLLISVDFYSGMIIRRIMKKSLWILMMSHPLFSVFVLKMN